MTEFRALSPRFSVAAHIEAGDLLKARAEGFHTVINNRPDEEQGVTFASKEAGSLARTNELEFIYLPTENHLIYRDETIERFIGALEGQSGPVLAYCKSGTRCTILWALAASRFQPAEQVFHHLMANGFEQFDILEEDMAEQSRTYLADDYAPEMVPAIFRLTTLEDQLSQNASQAA